MAGCLVHKDQVFEKFPFSTPQIKTLCDLRYAHMCKITLVLNCQFQEVGGGESGFFCEKPIREALFCRFHIVVHVRKKNAVIVIVIYIRLFHF